MSEIQPTDTSSSFYGIEEYEELSDELIDTRWNIVSSSDELEIKELKNKEQLVLKKIEEFKIKMSNTFFVDYKFKSMTLLGPYRQTKRFYFDDMITKIIATEDKW